MTDSERILAQRKARLWRQREDAGRKYGGRRHREAIERRDRVIGFLKLGLSQREIAVRVGVSQPAVLKILKRWVRVGHLLSD